MPQTTFVPRRNSAAEKALAFVRRQGRATSGEIAVHCGVESNAVMAILKACVEHGLLVSCLVARGGGKSVAEYRPGSGMEPAPDRPLKLDRAARIAAERTAAAAAPPVAGVGPLAGMEAPRGRDRAAPGRGPARDDVDPPRRPGRPAGKVTPPAPPVAAASAPRSPIADHPRAAEDRRSGMTDASLAEIAAAPGTALPRPVLPVGVPLEAIQADPGNGMQVRPPTVPDAVGTLVAALKAAGIEAVEVQDVSAALAAGGVRLVVDEPAAPRPGAEWADPVRIPEFLRQRNLPEMSAGAARRRAETDAAAARAAGWGFSLDDLGWLVLSSPDLDDLDLELPPAATRRLAAFLFRCQADEPFDHPPQEPQEPAHA